MTQHIVIHTLGTYTHLGRTSYCSHSTINQGPLEHFTHTFIWTNTILQALHTALTLAGTTHTHKRSWLKQSQLPIHTHSYSLPLPFHWKQKTSSMQAVQQRGWACSGPGLTCSCCYRDPATGWYEALLCPLHGKVIETSTQSFCLFKSLWCCTIWMTNQFWHAASLNCSGTMASQDPSVRLSHEHKAIWWNVILEFSLENICSFAHISATPLIFA